jgi:hypothetical protein
MDWMKKWLRWTIGTLLTLGMLAAAVWWEENWRGQRIWEESTAKLRAMAEPVELADLVPPLVPDEENVATAPIFAEVFATDEPGKTRLGSVPRSPTYTPKGGSEEVRPPMPRAVTKDDTKHLEEWRTFLAGYLGGTAPSPSGESSPDEVLRHLGKWDAEWREVAEAMQRPKCRWPLNYDDERHVKSAAFEAVGGLLYMARPRLIAHAVKNDGQAYADTMVLCLKLARTLHDPPVDLIAHLLGMSSESILLSLWQDTLACVELNDAQLQALQREAQRISLQDTVAALRCERVRTNHSLRSLNLEMMLEFLKGPASGLFDMGTGNELLDDALAILVSCRPKGWKLADAALHQEYHVDHVTTCVSVKDGTITPAALARMKRAIESLRTNASVLSLERFMARTFDAYSTILNRAAHKQARANMAVAWCAVERFRLKHGRLPETLDEVGSEIIDKLPCDPVNGKPLRYLRKGERDYLIYSVAWNGKDDGGVHRRSSADGDWSWASNPKLIENPDREKERTEKEGNASELEAAK